MGKRVLILGGGFGGVAAARRLRDLLDKDDEIVLIDKATHFAMGFRKTSAIIGRGSLQEGSRPLSSLERFGITVVNAEIERIDPGALAAEAGGTRYEADAMLVALGAETAPSAVPGLAEHGIDWYSFEQVERAREAVATIERGRVVVGIFGAPYKCPPAPFELGLLLYDLFRERGVRGVELGLFTPLHRSIPIIGEAGCEVIEGRLVGVGVDFRRDTKAERVEPGRVVIADGEDVPFDVLLAVPPHRVPRVVTEAGLAPEGGWIKADPATLVTDFDGVWAAGDAAAIMMNNGMPMPKAGAFAAEEGVVIAEQIAARFRGETTDARFWGDGACFLETGDGEAMMVRGRFLAEGKPDVELTKSSPEFLEEKNRFERDKLAAWFEG